MFTGIVSPGILESVEEKDGGALITVRTSLASKVSEGESVSINGACMTAVSVSGNLISFDVMSESLGRTNLSGAASGDRVNVELPLRAGDMLGGHLMSGHIDGVGEIVSKEGEGNSSKIWVSSYLAGWMVEKGSVGLDGVSMTVVDVEKDKFSVSAIPKTLESTTLGSKFEGSLVNIEVDILAKYVKKFLTKEPR